MPFPQPSDYDDAIQNPATAFVDSDLRRGINDGPLRFGMPGPVVSGNFGVVYRFRCGSKRYAVKCFTRQPPKDQAERYSSIHKHLRKSQLTCASDFQYLPQGVRVHGIFYPVLKMEWMDAPTLLQYAILNLNDRKKLLHLSDSFLNICKELRRSQIAHGDLQHGNLLVLGENLRIIDYDGMCVPGTAGLPSMEDGLPHYQHPSRQGGKLSLHFDHFPSLVIWSSLYALSLDPGLWARHVRNEERLLFSKDDYSKPQQSAVIRELLSYADERLSKAVTALRDACGVNDLAKVPPLMDVIGQAGAETDPQWWRVNAEVKGAAGASRVGPTSRGRPSWMQKEELASPPVAVIPRPCQLLVVYDDLNYRRVIQLILEKLGYTVLCGSAEDALKIAAQNTNIQLLITAVMMPGMNGQELARKLRETHFHIEVLYLSAFPPGYWAARGMDFIDRMHFLPIPIAHNMLEAETVLAERVKALLANAKWYWGD